MAKRKRIEASEEAKMAKRKRTLASPPLPPPQRTRRSMRRSKTICSCTSPSSTFLNAHSTFSWYEQDLWTEIAKYLDARSLVMLSGTSRWFNRVIMEDSVWRFVCLRDLQVPAPCRVSFKWIDLYSSAFNGSHSFMFRQQEKHIDWMRIGAFSLESPMALLTERLIFPVKIPREDETETMLKSNGCCVLNNVKTGIWIADLQLVRCPVCDLNTCDGEEKESIYHLWLQNVKCAVEFLNEFGTMQTLDARHIELFLSEGYRNGSWKYEVIGSHDIKKNIAGASGAIFDINHLGKCSTSAVFNLKSWIGKLNDWQPRAVITLHAVAVNTNLQKNEGLHVKYHAMRAGADGEVVSIRISQQLL